MTGPDDGNAADAAASGHLRASHADREHVVDVLKAGFVQGRLTKAELDARVGQAFVARTYADLAALTADVPAGLADAGAPSRVVRARARRPMSNAAKAGICSVIAVAVAVIASIPTGGAFLFVFAPFYLMAVLIAGAQMLASRHDKRSRGQLPPGPAQTRRAVEDERDAGPGNDLMLCHAPGDTRARRLRGHSVTRRVSRSLPPRQASPGLST